MHKLNCTIKIQIDGQLVEQENMFKYLASLISPDGYCAKERHNRIPKEYVQGQEKTVLRQIKFGTEEVNVWFAVWH